MAAVLVDEWPDLEDPPVAWLEEVAVLLAVLAVRVLLLKRLSRLEEAHFDG